MIRFLWRNLIRWLVLAALIVMASGFVLERIGVGLNLPENLLNILNTDTTPSVTVGSRTIVRDIQRLALIQSGRSNIEKVITAETGTGQLFSFLTGDRLLFVAVGSVTAGVDLSNIGPDDVQVISDEQVLIHLPSAQLIDCFLDEQESYIYTRERALFASSIDLETHARRAALVAIREAALEANILQIAQDQAQRVIEALTRGLGFREVIFDVAPNTPLPLESETCFGTPIPPEGGQ